MATSSVIGWLAAFRLAVEDWRLLEHPGYQLSCDISPVVGCGSAMASAQGNLFGWSLRRTDTGPRCHAPR
ncbi:vitamin K epoxide reductase family protein [Streptomyces spiralis]